MTTSEIALLLQARGFRFSKTLGQNFLMDEEVLDNIVQAADVQGKNVLEIGAGAGCLTRPLARTASKVLAVEIASQLVPVLKTVLQPYKNVRILQADALRLDIGGLCAEAFGGPFSVCANLPYGITTPILTALFRLEEVESICVLLQKEAVERVLAAPGGKEYGPLAILRRQLFEAEVPLRVPPHCFLPEPHVDSAVLCLRRKRTMEAGELAAFERLLQGCFAMRRKTLLNNLSQLRPRQEAQSILEAADIDPSARAEALSLEDFLRLHRRWQKNSTALV